MSAQPQTITDQLLEFTQANVPADALQMMRLSLFDWAACGIAAPDAKEFKRFKAAQLTMHPGPHVVIGGGMASAPTAALVNGTLSHALDYDDTHFAHIGHPSVAVLPAALAIGEHADADMNNMLQAATLGVEASILVGLWLGRDHYQVGYHQTATAGAFGATLAACRLLNLSTARSRDALGLCASMASGIKAQFGTSAKPLNAGLAARTGVEAALWAQASMDGAYDGLAGPLGFGPTHHGQANDVALPEGKWRIMDISHKFHACCHGLHAMLEALGGAKLKADDIETLHIRTHPRWMSVCNIRDPQTGLAAKFSYRQTAAMTVLGHDTSSINSYTKRITQDPEVLEMRKRIKVSEDAALSETQSEVTVTFKDGTTRHLKHDLLTPMSVEDRIGKLQGKAESLFGFSRAYKLWEVTQGDDLRAFSEQLQISW